MSLQKLWLILLVMVSILTITVNIVVFTSLTGDLFTDYLRDSHQTHVNQIIEYTTNVFIEEDISFERISKDFSSHIIDPIIAIELLGMDGEKLVSAYDENHHSLLGVDNEIVSSGRDVVERYDIVTDGKVRGTLIIALHSFAEDSFIAIRLRETLMYNGFISLGIAIFFSLVLGMIASGVMSKSLKSTEVLATSIMMGENVQRSKSYIREINAIEDSLINLNNRLKIKHRSRKKQMSQLVHQTRTPLAILKSHIEAFEDGLLEVNEKELEICNHQIDVLSEMITDMSRVVDADKMLSKASPERFDICSVINQITGGLKPQFSKKGICLDVGEIERAHVQTDRSILSQVIYNILTNAYKYTKTGGKVTVECHKSEDQFIINIADDGIGISEKDQRLIFDAYFRSNEVTSIEGEGLGLYIAKENMDLITGQLFVKSTIGEGSVFTIRFPNME